MRKEMSEYYIYEDNILRYEFHNNSFTKDLFKEFDHKAMKLALDSKIDNLLTLSMGSGPKCDVEFLFIQDVIGTNTDRVPRHAKVFKDTNKSYENLLDDTIEGLKNFIKDVNTKKFPTPSNIVEIKDEEFEKFLNKVG